MSSEYSILYRYTHLVLHPKPDVELMLEWLLQCKLLEHHPIFEVSHTFKKAIKQLTSVNKI